MDAINSEDVEEVRSRINGVLDAVVQGLADAGECKRQAWEVAHSLGREREELAKERNSARAELEGEWEQLRSAQAALELERRQMSSPGARRSETVTLNIGGEKVVERRRATLCAVDGSYLAARFSGRWEANADRDVEGRHFLNYSPEFVLPVLDYLTMRETQASVAPPTGPPNARPQFQAMLKFFGLLVDGLLDAVSVPYNSVLISNCGLAFEVTARSRSASLVAVETCAGSGRASATVFAAEGPLSECLQNRVAWVEVGLGTLREKAASRIELDPPVHLRAGVTQCIYIATDQDYGIVYVDSDEGIVAENDHLQICSGRHSCSRTPFGGFTTGRWRRFNGKLEYSVFA